MNPIESIYINTGPKKRIVIRRKNNYNGYKLSYRNTDRLVPVIPLTWEYKNYPSRLGGITLEFTRK